MAKAGIQVRTGRKWRVEEAVQEAELRRSQRRLVGVVTQALAGLESFPTPQTPSEERKGAT